MLVNRDYENLTNLLDSQLFRSTSVISTPECETVRFLGRIDRYEGDDGLSDLENNSPTDSSPIKESNRRRCNLHVDRPRQFTATALERSRAVATPRD
jgi:hypothetical protein